MGIAEMKELASVIRSVLSHTVPEGTETDGKKEKSRVRYILDPSSKTEAKSRAAVLLGRFRLYPELEENVLKEIVGL